MHHLSIGFGKTESVLIVTENEMPILLKNKVILFSIVLLSKSVSVVIEYCNTKGAIAFRGLSL